jgi:hypothetical protein
MVMWLLCALVVNGCATHGLISVLPTPSNPQEAAEIVVARESRLTGSAVTFVVTVNGAEIYGLRVGEHVVMRVNPGDQIIGARYRSAFLTMEEVTVSVRAEARGTYYFRIDPGIGAPVMNAVTSEVGRALIAKTKRILP